MNLIKDQWIPVIRQDGSLDTIKPWQIVEQNNPIIELNAPRSDFQGALYQFLIGLLQTCFPPKGEVDDEWLEYWQEAPREAELKDAFKKVAPAFELDNHGGPAFMQDFELESKKADPIESLVIGAPGANTIKKNIDLFQKRNQIKRLCESCTTMALMTWQLNGPPKGSGYKVGLRGNGPVTTLVKCLGEKSVLFHSLWMNIIPCEDDYDPKKVLDASIFPWLDKTKTSESCSTKECKTGCNKCGTFPEDVNSLHRYWSMPSRIKLSAALVAGKCDICGKESRKCYQEIFMKPKGFRYVGAWEHPLTPYKNKKDHENLPIPLKGQVAGSCYKNWVGLTLQDTYNNNHCAEVVRDYWEEKLFLIDKSDVIGLWCFGFDMESGQAKAKCWYEQQLPLFHLDNEQRTNLIDWAGEFIRSAREIVKILRTQVKAAWFRRPGDVKGDMSVMDQRFWQATEPKFYQAIEELAVLPGKTRMAPPEIYKSWYECLRNTMFRLFEEATLESAPRDLDLKRIVSAQQAMIKKFYMNKTIKSFKAKAIDEEVA